MMRPGATPPPDRYRGASSPGYGSARSEPAFQPPAAGRAAPPTEAGPSRIPAGRTSVRHPLARTVRASSQAARAPEVDEADPAVDETGDSSQGLTAKTNKMLDRVDHPTLWHIFHGRLPSHGLRSTGTGVAIRDLRRHLSALGNNPEANQARAVALWGLAKRLNQLSGEDCRIAFRALARFLVIPHLPKSVEIVGRELPEVVKTSFQPSGPGPLFTTDQRIAILRELLAVRHPPLPLDVMKGVLEVGRSNYRYLRDNAPGVAAAEVLAWLVDTANSIPTPGINDLKTPLEAGLMARKERVAGYVAEVFRRFNGTRERGSPSAMYPVLADLQARCRHARGMFNDEQWRAIDAFDPPLPQYVDPGAPPGYVQSARDDAIEPAP